MLDPNTVGIEHANESRLEARIRELEAENRALTKFMSVQQDPVAMRYRVVVEIDHRIVLANKGELHIALARAFEEQLCKKFGPRRNSTTTTTAGEIPVIMNARSPRSSVSRTQFA
jgi:hypothetical protein